MIFKFLLCFNLLFHLCISSYDPYKILGVSRHATAAEIRKAYKLLVKELHPDKNKSPEAEEDFVKLVKAYELLTDAERRQLYDDRGFVDESTSLLNRHDDSLYSFATGGLFHSSFTDGIAYLHKESISGKSFETVALPKSFSIPQLLLFYGDYCPGCARAAATWRTITEELVPIGVDVATLHAERERAIARRMGVSGVPAIILLIDGLPHILRESVISASRVVAFVRSKLPVNELLTSVNDENIQSWLGNWLDNRVRVLIFTDTSINIRLRYLILAFQYRERASFGVTSQDSELKNKYGLSKAQDNILLFKEYSVKPVATLSMSDIPYGLMKDLLENNKFLVLPRLSSQGVLETICPAEPASFRRRLCVVLITPDDMSNVVEITSLRSFANSYVNPRVRFAYVFKYKQQEFVQSLNAPTSSSNLVIIWRQDKSRISYEWVSSWVNINSSSGLDAVLDKLLNNQESNYHVTEVKELTDEHSQGFLTKLFKKINLTMTFLKSHLTKDNVVQTTSLIATILFIVAGGFIMAYLVRLEEESILAKANNVNQTTPTTTTTPVNHHRPDPETVRRRCSSNNSTGGVPAHQASGPMDLRIHELRGETYNGLVRLIKPGCRTLVLLLDTDSKAALMPKFQRCVWPYRKNKSLQFCFMHVDRGAGLSWYKQLLLLSLSEQRSLNINPRNCVGTVLSLNGHRKYFCVFHATLPGISARKNGYRNGGFLGFEDSDDSDTAPDLERGPRTLQLENPGSGILFTNHLLDNLSNWLDRLFEGSTHRYHVNYWPEFPFK
ncbi:unnamed protein product [Allacma fusca]|uniref:DnaJ homolog subfamily C member 16 n=1 Tax=Allacma fusca TaxID=39272 RepID=A0A8J2LI12_9HEXA|nr:unnamed protein product [Allacma fusca]